MGDWKIVGSAGTVVAASIPDAPNVLDTGGTLTTVTVTYGLIGNASAFGFSWSISLPEGHADYAHLKKIHVVWVRGSRLVELLTHYHPWSASPLAGEAGVDTRFLQDASAHTTDVVKFLCENDNGTITASPVSKTVTVAASTVSAVSGADASSLATNNPEYHARFKDSATALHTVVNGHVSMSGALYPQTATLWINKQDGNGPQWQGWWRIAEAAQLVQIGLPDSNTDVYPPGGASDGSWLLIAAAGAIPKESSVPASAVISSAFTVPTIPAPSSTWATAAWIDQINYGNNGQVNTWGWKNLFTTLPYDNPDFFFGRWTVQNGSLVDGVFTPGTAGNFAQHDGAEVAFTDDDNGGNGATVLRTPGTNIVTVTNPLMWTLPAYRLGDGSLNPNSCFRFRNYTGSRRDTDGSGGTIVKQNDWSAGVGVSTPGTADHFDVVLDLTKALIHGRQLVADSVPASAISAVSASDIQGTLYASSIGSVNASTLNGTIYASSIGSVNAATLTGTIYASSIGSVSAATLTGTIYASSIGSVSASTIAGTIYASSIGSVSASTIAGTIYASSIGSVSAATLTGMVYASSIGSVSASTIAGTIYASSIGSVSAATLAGTVYASSIGSVAASVINGALYASSIASVSATTINGLIVTSQIAAGIMDSLNKFAAGLSVVQRVTALPSTAGLPDGALALLTVPAPARLYQIVAAAWTLVTASTAITGQLQAADIASIQASQINGLILAGQISQINASQINGAIYASSIGSVSASVLSGSIYASSIATVNAGAIAGTISAGTLGTVYATSIASVYATAISGTISAATLGTVYASSIGSVNATAISGTISATTLGTVYASSIATVNATALAGKIYASSIGSVAASTISGTISAVNLGTIYASSIASVAASSIGSVYASSITMGGTSSIDSINVGSGGMFFTGTGGIVIAGSGGLSILVGAANANYFRAAATIFPDSGGFQIGTTVCIDATAKGNFSSLQVQGGTRIDASANAYFANISRNGTEIGNVFAAKGTYNVMDGGSIIGTVTL